MNPECSTPESAIETSIAYDTITHLVGDPADLIKYAYSQGYDVDSVEFNDVTEVWGWTDETPEAEMDWRVYVHSPH